MRFNFTYGQVLALIGSVAVHSSLLVHSGLGNVGAAIPEPKLSILSINLLDKTTSIVAACSRSGNCEESQINKEPTSKVALAKKINLVSSPIAKSATPPAEDPFIGLGVNYYFERNELSRLPTILINPHIRLPDDDDPRIIGSVKLRIFLSMDGRVDNLIIEEASVPEAYVNAIISGYKQLLFLPGEVGGNPVKSQLEFEINFTTEQTQSPVLRRNR